MITSIIRNAKIVFVVAIILFTNICNASISDALDTTLIFGTGGDADWFNQTLTSYYDGDAAQSGDINNNQESWMETTVTGPGALSFYWKVSSEANYDFLEFYIDGSRQNLISGSVDWQQMGYAISSGSHNLEWRYTKDNSVSSGSDCGWVDKVEWTPGGELPSTTEYIYCAGLYTGTVWKLDKSDLSKAGESPFYGWALLHALVEDDDYVYCGGETDTPKVWKLEKSDLLKVDESPAYGGIIRALAKDDNYIYCAGDTQKAWKLNKSDLSLVAESPDYGGAINALAEDNSYIYCGGWTTKKIWKLNKSDLSFVAESPAYGSTIWAITADENYIYFGGYGTKKVWKLNKSDLSKIAESTDYGGGIGALCEDSDYVYCGGQTNQKVWKLNKSDLSKVMESIDYGGEVRVLAEDSGYVYCGGYNTQKVWKLDKSDLSKIAESIDYGGAVHAITGEEEPSSPPPPPSSGSLPEALDTTLTFGTGGDAEWYDQASIFYYDGDAAQSGHISNNQESWIQTTVTGPGTLRFYWKVSSEDNYDFLEFYIDGYRQNLISGSVDWQQKSYAITSGSHILVWRYIKDGSVSSSSDCGWVDKIEWTPGDEPPAPPPSPEVLSEALDTTLNFATGGNADWFKQTAMFYYDEDAAQSGHISHYQNSWMQTNVTGPGTLSFYWYVSSEANFDSLEFYIDSSRQNRISGSVGADWQQMSYAIPSGPHNLVWRYIKDGSESAGNDCGWVDKVEWVESEPPTPPPPPPSDDLLDALDTTLDIVTGGNADWFNQTETFYYDQDAAQSGHISNDQESWMQATVTGPGTLRFYWKVSSEDNYDFLEFYINGYRHNYISGSVDWQQKSYVITSGSHTLVWRYVKDGSMSSSSDCGWVDKVEWTPGDEPPVPPPPLELLSEALDTTLDFTTGGNADWFSQSSTFLYDQDAAQSGRIFDNQESWMQTTVTGPGTLSFYWYIISEFNFDFLEFYIDGSRQNRISGSVGQNWQQKSYNISSGPHTLVWRYVKDGSVSYGGDCGWVDKVEWVASEPPPPPPPPPSNSLSDALETTLDLVTGGDAEWFNQISTFYNDGDAAQSGHISNNQESWMQATVTGPGALSFYWKVSSEGNYDFLEFYIDGSRQHYISGTTDWQQKSYAITSGPHTLVWRYIKDSSMSAGNDCGWVDKVEWVAGGEPPTPPPPSPSASLSDALDTTLTVITGGNADWFSQTSIFYNGGDAAQSGRIFHDQESWMQTTVTGPGTLRFYWRVSSEPSYDFLEFYVDGSRQNSTSGSASSSWQQVSHAIPSGSHTLVWRYVKDSSISINSDCGWVDWVRMSYP